MQLVTVVNWKANELVSYSIHCFAIHKGFFFFPIIKMYSGTLIFEYLILKYDQEISHDFFIYQYFLTARILFASDSSPHQST